MSDPKTSKETKKLLGSSKQTYEFLEWKDSLEDLCKSTFAEGDLWKLFAYGTEPEDQQLATLIESLNLYKGISDSKYNKAKLALITHCDKRKEKRIKLFIWIWGKVDESSQKGIKSSAVYKPIYDEASRTVDIIGLLSLLYNYHNCDLVAEGANKLAADDRYRNMNKMGISESLRDFKTRHDNALNPYLASLSTEEDRAKFKSSGDSKLRLLRKLSDSYKEFGATEQFKNSADLEEIFAEAEKWYQYRVLVGIVPKDNSNPKKPDSIVGATLTPNLLKKIQNEAIQTHMAKSESEITAGVTLDIDKKNKKNKKNKKTKETDNMKPGDKKPEPNPSAQKICDLCKAAREVTGDKSINFSNHASKNCFRLKHWKDVSAFVGLEDAFVESADTDDSLSEENDYIVGKNEVLMLDDEDFETPYRVKKKNLIDRFVTCPNTGKKYPIPPNADNLALLERDIIAHEHLRENRWRTSYPEQAMIWDKHVQKVRASLPVGTNFPENLILDFDYLEPVNALRESRRSTGTAYQSPIVGKDYIPNLKSSDTNPLMDSLMLKGDNLMLEQNNIFLNLRSNLNSPILQISPEGKIPFSQPSDKVEMRGIRDSRKVKYNSVLDSKESRTIDLHSQESSKKWTCKCGEENTGPVCQLCYSQNPLRQLQSKFPSERVSLSNSIPVSNSNIKQNALEIANSFWSNVDYDLNSTDDIYLLNSVTRDIESNLAQLESSRNPSNQETNLFSALKVEENEDELESLISDTSSSDSTPNSSKSAPTVLSSVVQPKTEKLANSTQDELNKLVEYCDSILEFFKAKDPKSREYTASLRIKAALIDLQSDIPLDQKDLADSDYFKDIACPVSEFIRKTKPKSNRIHGEKRFTYFREKKWRKLYGMVIWDTGTVNHMFHASMVKLVERIRKLDQARIFHGVGGSITVTESGDLKILKNIFFAENTPRNLVSQGQLVDEGFDIEYNKHNDCFTAEKDDFKLLFVREGRIYVLDTVFEKGIAKNEALSVIDKNKDTLSKDSKDKGAKEENKVSCDDNLSENVFQTRGDRTVSFLNNNHVFWESEDDRCVELSEDQLSKIFNDCCCACQNCNFNFCLPAVNRTLTRDEIKRAELGRKYHRLTGHRGRAAEIQEINRGGMKNLNVTVKDLELVDKVFGPCPVCHQAKSFNPKPDTSSRIKSTKIGEIQYFDVFFVRGGDGKPQPILIFVDEASRKVLLIKSKTRKSIAIEDGVKLITKWYNSRGYDKPRIIYSDNEKSVKAYSKKFKGRVMFKAAGEHVGVAEAYIGAIKTILRSIIIDLPYNFPLFYLNYLLKEAAMLLSLKPTSTSNGVSIMEAIRGVKPDLEKLKHPFGAYGLATTPSNQLVSDLQEKSEYGLLLSRPATGDLNFRVLLLDSLRVVSRKNFDVLPFNDEIVKRINALSSLDFNKEDPDQLGGDVNLTDGFETDLDSDEIMDLRRVPLHFKNDVTKGIFNNSIQMESTKNVKVDSDFLPSVDPSEVDKLIENQKSFKMEEDIVYGRGRRKITKPELLSLFAEQNELVKKKIFVEQRMTTKKALVKHGITAENSVYSELKQIVDRDIIKPTTYSKLKKLGINKRPIRSFLFNKEKFDLSGMLEKLKARLVAGGNMVDVDDLGDITSPTVKMETVMLLFSLASYYSYDVSVLDVPCAFLHTKLPESDYTPMIISKEEAEILVKINPSWVEYLLNNGEMLVLVTGGLYGLPQSPKLWYDALTKAIIKLGYKKSAMDPCLFVKIVSSSERSYLSLHVDDIGHFYTHKYFQVELENMLKKEFTEPTVQSGDEGIYLGLEYKFNRVDKSLEIGMSKYISKLLEEFQIYSGSKTCCAQNFMEIDNDSPRIDSKKFAGAVMSLYYLASRIRRDLLFAVTVMSTRIHACNKSDEKKLSKIFRYLYETRDRKIFIKLDGVELRFYIDASYAIHWNARSHTGLVVSLGSSRYGGPVFARSIVQKLVTLSSFEAELNGVHQNVYWFHFYRNVMEELGFPQTKPSILYQDNQATILVMNRGNIFKGRSKHVDVRYYYLTELIEKGIIKVEYLPTDQMIADPLTKSKSAYADEADMKRLQNIS